ncbi:MAG TPA: GNAT family N-acetyltransferase [Flavipsychrobacter sp.]|nr:GNAT family N-acetyltransferase [Flavipsychrobacter sp.]
MKGSYVVRNLRQEEMEQLTALTASEGWNPGLKDGAAFFKADPDGFFVGLLDGVPIAYIAAVNYKDQYCFVGLYIVKEGYRSQGYGYTIWQHALRRLGALVTGLDGVPAQVENYKKSGFDYAFRQMRFATTALAAKKSENIHLMAKEMMDLVTAYDTLVFGTSRIEFLKAWLSMENAVTFVAGADDGMIEGYAVLRKCRQGYKIGPLFADNDQVAEQLFLACNEKLPAEESIYLDVPEVNASALALAKKYNMQFVFETARMYKSGVPVFPLEKVFGVTSFELG